MVSFFFIASDVSDSLLWAVFNYMWAITVKTLTLFGSLFSTESSYMPWFVAIVTSAFLLLVSILLVLPRVSCVLGRVESTITLFYLFDLCFKLTSFCFKLGNTTFRSLIKSFHIAWHRSYYLPLCFHMASRLWYFQLPQLMRQLHKFSELSDFSA